MPVVVTDAGSPVGRALVPLLVARGAEVRAQVDDGGVAEALRSQGAKVAVADSSDVGTLSVVMRDAHTVCHLAGQPPVEPGAEGALLEGTRWALEAAADAGVVRFLLLSCAGADPGSDNAILRALGEAGEEVGSSGAQHVILRCTHQVGPGAPWLEVMRALARAPVAAVVGSGGQRLAPVYVGDVAAALEAADDRSSGASGALALQGPDPVTADEMAALLGGGRRRPVHLRPTAARGAARVLGRRASPAFLDLLARDSVADAPSAAAEFGLRPTPLREALAFSGHG